MKRLKAYYNSERFLLTWLCVDSSVFTVALVAWLTH